MMYLVNKTHVLHLLQIVISITLVQSGDYI